MPKLLDRVGARYGLLSKLVEPIGDPGNRVIAIDVLGKIAIEIEVGMLSLFRVGGSGAFDPQDIVRTVGVLSNQRLEPCDRRPLMRLSHDKVRNLTNALIVDFDARQG